MRIQRSDYLLGYITDQHVRHLHLFLYSLAASTALASRMLLVAV